jgi:hypothetical protein
MVFKDDVRKRLREGSARLKSLRQELRKVSAEESERDAALKRRFASWDCRINPFEIMLEMVSLHKKAISLGAEIKKQQDLCGELEAQLAVAPKRPRIRTKVASIAASGTRTINVAAEQRPPLSAEAVWGDGIEAAKGTAKKYGLKIIPAASLQIMEARMREHFTKIEFFQRDDDPHPQVRSPRSPRSVRIK